MPRITWAQHEAQTRELRKSDHVNALAFRAALADAITWERWTSAADKAGQYRFGWSDLTRAEGGLFYSAYRAPGQSDYTIAQYLDDAADHARRIVETGGLTTLEANALFVAAVERAKIARNKEYAALDARLGRQEGN